MEGTTDYHFLSRLYEIAIMLIKTNQEKDFVIECRHSYGKYDFNELEILIDIDSIRKSIAKYSYEQQNQNKYFAALNGYLQRFYSFVGGQSSNQFFNRCPECDSIFIGKSQKFCKSKSCRPCLIKRINSKKADPNSRNYVYLMKSDLTGLLKIGFTKKPRKRKRELETAQGGTIVFLRIITGDTDLERILHRKFEMHRREGEWFNDVEEIREEFSAYEEAMIL